MSSPPPKKNKSSDEMLRMQKVWFARLHRVLLSILFHISSHLYIFLGFASRPIRSMTRLRSVCSTSHIMFYFVYALQWFGTASKLTLYRAPNIKVFRREQFLIDMMLTTKSLPNKSSPAHSFSNKFRERKIPGVHEILECWFWRSWYPSTYQVDHDHQFVHKNYIYIYICIYIYLCSYTKRHHCTN